MKSRQTHEPSTNATRTRRSRGSSRLGLAAIVAAALTLLAATAAQASTITVGSVLPPGSTPKKFEAAETLFNTALPEKGANLVSPANGAIVRWRIQGASGGPFYLRVLRPNGSGAYMAAGTSGPATPSGPGLQTFTANIPIHAGDLIGVDSTNSTDEIGVAEVPGANYGFIFPPPFDGATVAPSGGVSGQEIALNAEVQPAPAITSLAPTSGSIAGGTAVTITGTNLAGASAVKFGTTPATSFTVTSETEITAIAPANLTPSAVDLSVTTLAGTSPVVTGDKFTYTACVVPKLKSKKLKQAKRALWNAGCTPGTIKGKKTKTAKVTKQNPKPRKILVPGAKVNVKLAG